MKEKIKKIGIRLLDIVIIITYISIVMPLLGWLLQSSSEWKSISFGEFFSDNRLWFNVWISSLFYVPLRLLLKLGDKDNIV
jgi:hypothetical protein